MSKLSDLLSQKDIQKITKSSLMVGGVFRIEMNKEDGITPKNGSISRSKFFVILGFNSDGSAYGGVIFNSQINQKLHPDIKDLHMPIKREQCEFLEHDSFIDCSKIKRVNINKLINGTFLGCMDADILDIVIGTIKESPLESKASLALFGL